MAKVERSPAPERTLETLDDYLNVVQAAEAVAVHPKSIKRAIQRGDLKAFIPLGRTPTSAGRGKGYRIHKRDLQRWFFGDPHA